LLDLTFSVIGGSMRATADQYGEYTMHHSWNSKYNTLAGDQVPEQRCFHELHRVLLFLSPTE